jgi:glycosyltransferase involved in cell wall biosynthesis
MAIAPDGSSRSSGITFDRMKILYATRLFSGLQSTLDARRWQPSGVPTIFKLIEALDRGPDEPSFVLSCKDQDVDWQGRADLDLEIAGLRHPVRVLAGRRRFPEWLRRFAGPLREAAHAISIAKLCRQRRPDLVYLDHANLFAAGWLSLISRTPIVLRLMGVYPVMRTALDGGGMRGRLLRWCYRRPYVLVICTQDGSGVEPWLARALRPEVPRIVLINGIDDPEAAAEQDPRIAAIPADCTTVMFLGKLENSKGALEFAAGFLRARAQAPERLHALVVGTGSLTNSLRGQFAAAEASEALTLIERLPHSQVAAALARAEIYVSLNRFGNLSNANLEAMRAGKAMIVPEAQPAIGVDVATDKLLTPDSMLRIDSSDDIAGLADAILQLAANPAERLRRGKRVREEINGIAGSWDRRITFELDLLHRVARAEALPITGVAQLSAGATERIGK